MTSAPVHFRSHLLRRAHLRLLVRAVELAQDALEEPTVLQAAARFFGQPFQDGAALENWLSDRDVHSQFFPWLLWDAQLAEGPLGRRLLPKTTGPELEVLQGLLASRATVWQVSGASDQATVLERVDDGTQHVVFEPILRAVAARGELLIARVVVLSDCCLLDAVHGCVPNLARRGLVRAARRLPQLPPDEGLVMLLAAARRALQRVRVPTLPFVGGEGLLRATRVFRCLDAEAVADTLLLEATRGRLERPSPGRFVVVDAEFGPVGAVLRLTGDRLYATTTSPERLTELEATVQQEFPQVRPLLVLLRDLEDLLDPARRAGPDAELRSLARDWLGECLANFPDTPHAWLGGATPREAVQTPSGRLQLRAWLLTVEQVSEVAGPGYQRAVQSIWRELAEA